MSLPEVLLWQRIRGSAGGASFRKQHPIAFLRERGYRLLRIAATDVLKDPDGVAEAVVAAASDPLHHRASRGGPPPRAGEDHDA
jgi:hypothetical protein